ncbi:MAG: AAA family ATPase [Planctomycetota bacterium]
MPDDHDDPPTLFRRLLHRCRELYATSAQTCLHEFPRELEASGLASPGICFAETMDHLHKALAVKVFVSVCEADRRWSTKEQELARVLVEHLWLKTLRGDELRETILDMSGRAAKLRWYELVRPFDEIAPLRDRVGELETIAVRLANVVARADGAVGSVEAGAVRSIHEELIGHLRPVPIDGPDQHQAADQAGRTAIQQILEQSSQVQTAVKAEEKPAEQPAVPAESLDDVLAELDRLIGLAPVKRELRTLANFLKVQAERERAGLPSTTLSLHTLFTGNPGTGKTTVARLLGRVFGAMGVLSKGHLVETDRSGLVAEYAGQTGPKTNQKIDEALDGVLFIDEAYTLISTEGDDAFGREAVQTLLKRMEDDRDRLVVILAGYPAEMERLVESNPGLQSRFSRRLLFADYGPVELAQIFGAMCEKNHYRLPPLTRAKAMLGLSQLYAGRDAHFGNGRAVRNLFERAIRRMADRVAETPELSVEQLTTLEAADIHFERVAAEHFEGLAEDGPHRFRLECPSCEKSSNAPAGFLGRSVRCPKCGEDFVAEWGEVVSG